MGLPSDYERDRITDEIVKQSWQHMREKDWKIAFGSSFQSEIFVFLLNSLRFCPG
jgi:hypothetical protein